MSDGPKGCVLQITSSAALVLDLTLQRWCRAVRQPGERRVSHRVKLQDWTQKTSASFQDNWHIWHNFPWHWSHCCYSYSHVDVLSLALLLSPKNKKNLCRCFPLLSISGPRLLAILNVTLCRKFLSLFFSPSSWLRCLAGTQWCVPHGCLVLRSLDQITLFEQTSWPLFLSLT